MSPRFIRELVVMGLGMLAVTLVVTTTAEAQAKGRSRPKPARSRQVYVFPGNKSKVAAWPSRNQSRHQQDAAKKVLRHTEKARVTKPAPLSKRLSQYKAHKGPLGLKPTQPMNRAQAKSFMSQQRHGANQRRLYPQASSFRQSGKPVVNNSARLRTVRSLSSRLAKILPKRSVKKNVTSAPRVNQKPVGENLIQKLSAKKTKVIFGNGPGAASRSTEYRFLGLSKWRSSKPPSRASRPKVDLWKAWSNLWRE